MILDENEIGKFYKLKNVNRYGTYPRIKDESVAEHMYFTVLFTMLICDDLKVSHTIRSFAIELAAIHDIPEIILSDIPYSAKRAADGLLERIEMAEKVVMGKIMPRYTAVFEVFDGKEEMDKDECSARLITKLADVLSVIQYCNNEKKLGNSYISPVYDEALLRYEELQSQFKAYFGKRVKIFEEDR